MNRRRQYLVSIGIGILTLVVLVLLISPSYIFSPMITVIGGDLNKSSPSQVSVATKMELSDPNQVQAFPKDIGKWHGTDYDTTYTTKALNANVVMLREYDPDTFTQPLFLTIVQSKTNSSFHSLDKYCLVDQGFKIQENTKDSLLVTNPTWSTGRSDVILPLNRLVVTRNSKTGEIVERSVVLFFYVKGNQFYNDMITMIEVQGLAPVTGSYEDTLQEEKLFLNQVVPLLFQPSYQGNWDPFFNTLAQKGFGGYLAIALMLMLPLGIIMYPFIKRKGVTK
jgi:hypothetical protein